MARILRKLKARIHKLWDVWSKLQTYEDERWRNNVGGRLTSRKSPVDDSEYEVSTEVPLSLVGPQEHAIRATRASGESRSEAENESAVVPVPTLSELVAQRQSEYKITATKNHSREDAGQ